jgi:pimeloyl-ACP methyl ester carboxylesterase
MGWAKAHIMGYSFGGVKTATFTALHSQLVESVTLIAPAGLIRSSSFTEEELKFLLSGDGVDEGKARDWILNYVSGNPLVIADD